MATAEFRFPTNTPDTKEGYYFRTIFEGYFPQESAAKCVPGGKSIACSTVEALEWDASFKNMADPSGRSVISVHSKPV
jgi:asparagine synthase (glutamine-hydrolysing)